MIPLHASVLGILAQSLDTKHPHVFVSDKAHQALCAHDDKVVQINVELTIP
jgi:hypothetical protein